MSIAVVGFAFGLALPSREKWLLVCLADYADEWGDSIFPTLETLAEKSGMSEDTIKRALATLIKGGIIEQIAASTPVSPAFYRILDVPVPKKVEKEPTCPASLRRAAVYLFQMRCEYCKRPGTKELGPDGSPWTIDRVVPGLRGGSYSPDNVALACRFCNMKKRTKDAPEGTRTVADIRRLSPQNAPSPKSKKSRELPPSQGGTIPPSEGGTVRPDPLLDPGSDPLPDSAGAPPPRPRTNPNPERPEDNIRVITKIAHEAIEQLGPQHELLVETVKSLCANRDIRYNSAVVHSALDSARWQRTHRELH